jgi:hypothetical protein
MLKCGSCGYDNESTTRFCAGCGAQLDAGVVQQAAPVYDASAQAQYVSADYAGVPAETAVEYTPIKKPFPLKKLLMVAVPVAILAIAAVIVLNFFADMSVYGVRKDLAIAAGDEKTIIIYPNGKVEEMNVPFHNASLSMCGSRAAFLVDWDDTDKSGTLYHISGTSKPKKVADNVNSYKLSDTGKGLIFWKDPDTVDGMQIAELHHYNGSKTSLIHREAYFSSSMTAISPNGKTVLYLTDYIISNEDNEFDSRAFVSTNGNRGESLNTRNIVPIAISDGAKFIYYSFYTNNSERDIHLSVQRGLKGERKRLCANNSSSYHFNKDYSQIVFNSVSGPDDKEARISIKGGDAKRISNNVTISSFVIPDNAQRGRAYGFKDFRNKVFRGDDGGLYLLDKKHERQRFASSYSVVRMSNDGKWLYYTDRNSDNDFDLRRANAGNSNADKPRVARKLLNHSSFVIGKGQVFYYINHEKDLFRKKGVEDGDGAKVAEDVYELDTTGNGTIFFMTDVSSSTQEGTLQFTTNTKRNVIAGDISGFFAGNNSVFYYVNVDVGFYDVFRSSGNGRFKKIASDVKL